MEQSLEISRTWDRQPDETDKAWSAFQTYREMPLLGPKELRRNFDNLAVKLGHSSLGTIQMWSAKYNWQERCKAYDASNALKLEDYRLVSKLEATRAYLYQQSLRVTALGEIIEMKLDKMRETMLTPNAKGEYGDVDPRDLQRLSDALMRLDTLSRRMLNLPTVFKQGQAEDPVTDDEEIMVIGDKLD